MPTFPLFLSRFCVQAGLCNTRLSVFPLESASADCRLHEINRGDELCELQTEGVGDGGRERGAIGMLTARRLSALIGQSSQRPEPWGSLSSRGIRAVPWSVEIRATVLSPAERHAASSFTHHSGIHAHNFTNTAKYS